MLKESPLTFIRQRLAGIYPTPEVRSITRLLIEDGLGMEMLDFYTGKVTELSEEKETILREMLTRLAHNEPVQYVTGKTVFEGMPFHTMPGVLIPRPETEELVDWICETTPPGHFLDIGTGSGCIAVSLAAHFRDAEVEAWDISPDALRIAEENNRLNHTSVCFRQRDILTYQPEKEAVRTFDLIVSNPPYVTEKERGTMAKNVLDWEPATALFVPDDDPLRFYRAIAKAGQALLKTGGSLFFEINWLFAQEMHRMLEAEGYSEIAVRQDMFGKKRMMSAVFNPHAL